MTVQEAVTQTIITELLLSHQYKAAHLQVLQHEHKQL